MGARWGGMGRVVLVVGLLAPVGVRAQAAQPLSVAVFPLEAREGVEASLAALLTFELVDQARQSTVFQRVVSPQEITLAVGNDAQRQLAECARNECIIVDQELAGALGVTHMLIGTVYQLQGQHVVSLRLLDLRKGMEVATALERRARIGVEDLSGVTRPMVVRLITDGGVLQEVGPEARQRVSQMLLGSEPRRVRGTPWLTMTGLVTSILGGALLVAAVPPGVVGGSLLALMVPSILVSLRVPGVRPVLPSQHRAYGLALGGGPAASALAGVVGTAAVLSLAAGVFFVWAGRLMES
ncbi:MAG: hypothetical protein AB2A00_40865 [Myxococcota bacterium]